MQSSEIPEHMSGQMPIDEFETNTPLGLDFGTSTTYLGRFVAPVTEQLLPGRSMRSRIIFRDGEFRVLSGSGSPVVPTGFKLVRSPKRWIGEQNHDHVMACLDCDGSESSCADNHTRLTREEIDRGISLFLSEVVSTSRIVSNVDLTAPGAVRMGCPAIWSTRQRQRLATIAKSAGLDVQARDFVDEAIAAGIVWVRNQPDRNLVGKLLVVDMGGGTLDVAVLRVLGSGAGEVVVESSTGNTIAGDFLDRQLALSLKLRFSELGADVSDLGVQLIELSEAAKIRLSTSTVWNSNEATIGTPFFEDLDGYGVELSRDEFESIARSKIVPQMKEEIHRALRIALVSEKFPLHAELRVPVDSRAGETGDSMLKRHTWWQRPTFVEASELSEATLLSDVDYVVLAGGMTHMPLIEQTIRDLIRASGKNEIRLYRGSSMITSEDDSDTLVVQGLAADQDFDGFNFFRPNFSLEVHTSCPDHVESTRQVPIFEVGFKPAGPGWSVPHNQKNLSASELPQCCSKFEVCVRCVGPDGRFLSFIPADEQDAVSAIDASLVGRPPASAPPLKEIVMDYLDFRQRGLQFGSRGNGEFRAGFTNQTAIYRIATTNPIVGKLHDVSEVIRPKTWRVTNEGNQTGQK